MEASKSFSMHPAITADKVKSLVMDFSNPFADQVRAYFDAVGDRDLTGATEFGLPGQAVAAILTLPVLEMSVGLPTMKLFGFGRDVEVVGELDLADYRHNQVRPHRGEIPEGEAYPGYTILDGAGRGVEGFQLAEIATALDTTSENIRVVDVSAGHVDPAKPQEGLFESLVSSGLTKADWVSQRIIFLPPGFGPLAAVMATAIYGLSEVWPRTIRLNRETDSTFHVAEIVDPQSLRQFGVELYAKWESGQAPVLVPRELFDRLVEALEGTLLADELTGLVK